MAAFWLVSGAAVVAGATLMGADPLLPGLGVGAAGAVAKLTSRMTQDRGGRARGDAGVVVPVLVRTLVLVA